MEQKTYFLDGGAYIDSVIRNIAKSSKDDTPPLSVEEQALLGRVGDHGSIHKQQIICATRLMLEEEAQRLDDGNYILLSISNMFIACADRELTAP